MGRQTFIVSATNETVTPEDILERVRGIELKYYDTASSKVLHPAKTQALIDAKVHVTFEADNRDALSIHRNFTNELDQGLLNVEVTYMSTSPLPKAA